MCGHRVARETVACLPELCLPTTGRCQGVNARKAVLDIGQTNTLLFVLRVSRPGGGTTSSLASSIQFARYFTMKLPKASLERAFTHVLPSLGEHGIQEEPPEPCYSPYTFVETERCHQVTSRSVQVAV